MFSIISFPPNQLISGFCVYKLTSSTIKLYPQLSYNVIPYLYFISLLSPEDDVVRYPLLEEGLRDPEGQREVAGHTLALTHHEATQRLTLQHGQRNLPTRE